MDKKILNKIKQTRIAISISARRLGMLSDLSTTSICKIENGKMPSMKNLAKIISALDLHINEKLFLKHLKAKRKSLNATLERMGRISGVSHSIIHKAEQGIMPSIKTCCIIAKELNLPLEEFIDWPKRFKVR
ncbi:MAG: helix-turn-helix domain-containing protein [Coxiellaceae bacterium]|jgi:transcriptional regulator with XRE-family HTH domain|nr:helix-turn-helix domain-containing protein [Coxiellaceae bacterium]